MKRRDLFRLATAAAAAGSAAGMSRANAQSRNRNSDLEDDVDPYFLDSGDLTAGEHEAIIQVEQLQRELLEGRQVAIPRGLRPDRAPTYRLVYWTGGIGDPNGRFVSPLSVPPSLGPLQDGLSYRFNAQILGFHGASDDWGGRANQGTLTVEMRAGYGGQQMTWFYAQQFDMDDEGFTNVGYEYVAQREGAAEPVVTDELNIGLRIQLLRSPRRSGVALRKIIRTALVVTGVPLQLENRELQQTIQYLPPVRVPAMFQEGAALAQALVGGTAEEAPIWRGGFSAYGIAQGGSQLGLRPGYWMVIDAARETDLRDVVLEDFGGFVTPTRGGEPLDANYIVFSFEIDQGPAPAYINFGSYQGFPQQNDRFRQQQGFPQQNDPFGQQQGFPQQNTPFGQQQGLPQQNDPFGQQQGLPQQSTPFGQQQGIPQQNAPFGQQQGVPQQNAPFGQQQGFPEQNDPFGQQQGFPQGGDDPFSRAVPKSVPPVDE